MVFVGCYTGHHPSTDPTSPNTLVDVAVPGPVGKKVITENGTNIDIAAYATADVQVPQGVFPTGTKDITMNGLSDVTNYENVNVQVSPNVGTKSIIENGTYNASSDSLDGYSQVTVNVSGGSPLPSNITMQIVNVTADTETIEVTYDPTKTVGLVIVVPGALQLSAYEQTFIVGKMSFFSGDFSQLFGTYVNYNHTGEQSGTGSNAGSFTFDSTNGIITIGTKSSTYHFKAGDSFVVFIVYAVQ